MGAVLVGRPEELRRPVVEGGEGEEVLVHAGGFKAPQGVGDVRGDLLKRPPVRQFAAEPDLQRLVERQPDRLDDAHAALECQIHQIHFQKKLLR